MRTGECLDNCNGALSAKSLRFGRLVPDEHFPVRSIEGIVDWDVFFGPTADVGVQDDSGSTRT